MKYIYNPVTGTLDDVETPNLGEKYFASAETDEIITTIDEKFGPGTLFPASEVPVPENPYKDFEDRNLIAGIEDETRDYYLKYLKDITIINAIDKIIEKINIFNLLEL